MPYEIRKEGEKHCLYKKDDNKKIACHDTEDGAKRQMMAIHASENKKTLERYTQEAVAYTPVSTNGQMCAGCRWFIGVNQGGNACHIIDNFPIDIEPTGYCNEYAGLEAAIMQNEMPMMDEMPMMQEMAHSEPQNETNARGETAHAHEKLAAIKDQYNANLKKQAAFEKNIVEQSQRILDRLEHEQAEMIYIAPQPENILKKLVSKFQSKGGLKPGASVFKGADGARYMLIVTSNSYQDRDEETITTQALKEDTDRAWIAEDVFKTDNPLLFWHDDRVVIGQIVYADVKTPFLVELAREANNPVAKAIFDYREANPNEEWGASHRFGYFKKDRSPDGTYRRIYKQETSILPRDAAANLLTFSGVIPMTTKRDEYLNKMLGLPNAAELLDKGISAVVEAMEAHGHEHKSAEKPAGEIAAETEKTLGKFVMALMDSQADLMERQDTLESGVGTSSKSLTDDSAALKAQVKALADEVAQMKIQLDQRPRSASRSSETVLEDSEKEAALRQQFTKRDPFFGVEVKE